ncbi:MAG TPA: sensor domain-containing diguanylate cyclase [Solirubrobacteraceae bacterium]
MIEDLEIGSQASASAEAVSAGNHFSCSMTAVLVARVHDYGGDDAVSELLRDSGVKRSREYLCDIVNWVSYDEAVSLLRAGARVTHHPSFARAVGEDAARRLNGSPVASLLRSLGSPENVYRQIATTASKYSTVARLEAVEAGPGFVEIVSTSLPGFTRSAEHCAWTCGLLTQPPILFGLSAATVTHECCAAFGAPTCVYRVDWETGEALNGGHPSEQLQTLREQLDAMKERLHSMFQTAADIIGSGEITDVLARITERAAAEVRAPRHLLAVRMDEGGELHCHQKGFDEPDVAAYAERILAADPSELSDSWLVVPVRSDRRDYGRLCAMDQEGTRFFPQERELLQVYARYAAAALDSATGLMEARRRYGQSSALLELARELAAAGTSNEVARRLADAVPVVVDCDGVGVYLWDVARGALVRRALTEGGQRAQAEPQAWTPVAGSPLERFVLQRGSEPTFVDAESGDPVLRDAFDQAGFKATVLVPLAAPDRFLGMLRVSVNERPERLRATPDLVDRLSGVAAQATTALQNGHLLDQITHQALHDQLTGLANRSQFASDLRAAVHNAGEGSGRVTLFYIDLNRFKPVNDEFGHETGDALLVAVGARLAACTRKTDTVARLGGDEFSVLIRSGSNPSVVDAVAERLAGAFAAPFRVEGHELTVGASIGRATFPLDADGAESLLRRADAEMFAAKRRVHASAQPAHDSRL